MSIRNFITESIILPLSDIAVGHNIKMQLHFLQESQWWSVDQLINYQNEKLRILIRHAYQNVPYYKDIMDERGLAPTDIQTIEDLSKLPVLTKDVFKANYPDKLRAKNWKEYKVLHRSSSGSTGNPIQYLVTREGYSFNKACNLRGWYWMGFRLGDKLIKISQNERKTLEKKIQDKLDNTLLFSAEYSRDSLSTFIDSFKGFKPQYLRSYPDPLQFIAMILKQKDIKLEGLKAINTTGNILFPEVRELIEERFGVKIFDSYSCEGGPNFFECHTHECYHSSMEYGISEILDENLKPVNDGELGRLYTTDLWNYASPFIRYDSADIVRKSEKPCSCGRKLQSISQVIGRDNDVIISPNGIFLIAQTFTTYFKYLPEVLQFQIFQRSSDDLEIRLKVDSEKFDNALKSRILDYWNEYLSNSMKIELTVMDEIPLATSGKRRFLMRNKDIPFLI
jgi:phenylacetate-CoA ligase